jgi:hypothetical protein
VLFVDRRLRRRLAGEPLTAGVQLVRARSLLPIGFRQLYANRSLWALWRPVQTLAWAGIGLVGRFPLPADRRLRLQAGLARAVCTPMEARFFHYLRFLRHRPYERVVLTDVRDVLFQRDPSPDIPTEALGVGIETRRYTIATEEHNRRWVEQAFGSEMIDEIGASPVSCVGVTVGGTDAISTYLERMTEQILRLTARTARVGGADTSVHNVLLWTGRLGEAQHFETLASPLATLNGVPADQVKVSSAGKLLNADGSEPSIVHQYDRQPAVARVLLAAVTAGYEASRSANR